MKKTHKVMFTRIAEFKFNDQIYQMFKARKNKIAFLKINEKGHYEFPTYKEFSLLVRFFSNDYVDSISHYNSSNNQNLYFTPYIKELINGKVKKVMITSLLVLSCLTGCNNKEDVSSVYSYDNVYQSELAEANNLQENEPSDLDESFTQDINETVKNIESEDFDLDEDTKSIVLHNNKYFDELFGSNINLDDIADNLKQNSNIADNYKSFIYDFVDSMVNYYPNLEIRVLNHNLKDLKITTLSSDLMSVVTDGIAYYDASKNELVINENIDLENNLQDRLIFRHELGHLFNNVKMEKDGYKIRYYFNDIGHGKYLKEALNVIFTTEPFMEEYDGVLLQNGNYLTEDMGYALTTNIVRLLLSTMDYNIEDSVSNDVYYFDAKMNEVSPDNIDFSTIEELMELQCIEYLAGSITVNQEDYMNLYTYIAKVYIKANLNDAMSYNEIFDHCMYLQEELKKGVLDTDYVYMNAIEDSFKEYINEHNIEKSYVK